METAESARNVGGTGVVDEILAEVVIPSVQAQQPGTSSGVVRADLPDVSSIILLSKKYETFFNKSIA